MSTEFTLDDHRYMARAIQLARRGLYSTDPNPRVGCVLVNNDQLVGEGWHRKAGEPHAERIALAEAADAARGATAYVTLEPCCHHGRTPPCTTGLREAGVARVVAAMEDPNPRVAGKGMAELHNAGIATATGLLETDARKLNPGFIRRMTGGRPFVRCKLAMSLDGRTAMSSGESVWITGEDARRDVQRLRARSSVILSGVGTALSDDPSLTVRLAPAELPGVESEAYLPQPMRVILDSRLRLPPQAKMLTLPGKTLVIFNAADRKAQLRLRDAGAELLQVDRDERGLKLDLVLAALAQREVNEVLLEAGPTLAGSALQAGLVDELILYMAPHLMGSEGRGLFHLPGLERMNDRIKLDIKDIRQVGSDYRITAHPCKDK